MKILLSRSGCFRTAIVLLVDAGINKWPATADPVAIAAINEFIGPARHATLRSVLAGRQPDNQFRYIQMSAVISKQCRHEWASSKGGIIYILGNAPARRVKDG